MRNVEAQRAPRFPHGSCLACLVADAQAVPFNWIEYAHRALLWQVKDGGENFCNDTWGSKCQDEHGESGYPISPNTGLPVDGAQGRCCWCPAVWHLWLNNPNRGREPMLKCNFWGKRQLAPGCVTAHRPKREQQVDLVRSAFTVTALLHQGCCCFGAALGNRSCTLACLFRRSAVWQYPRSVPHEILPGRRISMVPYAQS